MDSSPGTGDKPHGEVGGRDGVPAGDGSGGTATRRRVLLAGMAAATAGIAGCSGVTEQSFEASPVGLSTAARDELRLRERASESQTLSKQGPAGEVEVSITTHVAVYSRADWLAQGPTEGE